MQFFIQNDYHAFMKTAKKANEAAASLSPASDRLVNITRVNHARAGHHATFGEAHYIPGGVCGPRIQRDYQLVVLLSGEAVATVNGEKRAFRAGQVALMLPGQQELVAYTRDKPTHHTWVAVTPDFVPKDLAKLLAAAPKILATSDLFSRLMDAVTTHPSYKGEAAMAMVDALGLTMLREYLRTAENAAQDLIAQTPVDQAMRHMEDHLGDENCLADAAKAAGVTSQHLIKCFRAQLGVTPGRYLWQLRIERATGFLMHSGMTVSEVASRCGFKTVFHFSRMFREVNGKSPRDFRKGAWA